jgi:hypothetical protein
MSDEPTTYPGTEIERIDNLKKPLFTEDKVFIPIKSFVLLDEYTGNKYVQRVGEEGIYLREPNGRKRKLLSQKICQLVVTKPYTYAQTDSLDEDICKIIWDIGPQNWLDIEDINITHPKFALKPLTTDISEKSTAYGQKPKMVINYSTSADLNAFFERFLKAYNKIWYNLCREYHNKLVSTVYPTQLSLSFVDRDTPEYYIDEPEMLLDCTVTYGEKNLPLEGAELEFTLIYSDGTETTKINNTDENGKATQSFEGEEFVVGNAILSVDYDGDKNHEAFHHTFTVHIKKIPTRVDASLDDEYTQGINEVQGLLWDDTKADGEAAIEDETVTVTCVFSDESTYTTTGITDEEGAFTVNIPMDVVGPAKLIMTYEGSDKYKSTTEETLPFNIIKDE